MRWEKENWVKEVAVTASVDVEKLLSRQWEDDGVDKEEQRLMRKKRAARRGRVSIGGTLRAKANGESSESGSEVEDIDEEEDDEEFYDPNVSSPSLFEVGENRSSPSPSFLHVGSNTLPYPPRLLPAQPPFLTRHPHLFLPSERSSSLVEIGTSQRNLPVREICSVSV